MMITPKEKTRRTSLSRYWDWDPFREFSRIHRMMNDLMNEIFGTDYSYNYSMTPSEMKNVTWMPPVNMYLKDNNTLCMEVWLPGMSKENIELSVTSNTITISGTSNTPENIPSENWIFYEFPYGKFHRTIELPYEIKPNEVKATYENGILKITMPLMTPEKEQVKVNIN